ncbi:MAG: filamentous hemagglutinin N-terminal domain-containing protein, partial [Cyanobacteria bacterium J06558_2]
MKTLTTGVFSGIICLIPSVALAQIVPDGSTSTTVTPNGNVDTIEAGEQVGGNLFHSFSEFSVTQGREAFFNNGLDIERIFSRVTGGNSSTIDGLIRANGNASLFLINPAGILFNDSASLAIGGSFYGTTADSVLWSNGAEFGVNSPEIPTLTINAPIGLNFRDNPNNIAVNNASLGVASGQSFNLVGGEISLDGSSLSAFEGGVNLAGVASAGTVNLTETGLDLGNLALADVDLGNGSIINVNRGGDGAIFIGAQNLTLSEGSILNGGIDAAAIDSAIQGGNVSLQIADTLTLESGSLIRNNISAQSFGNSGDILIEAQNLAINDGSRIITFSQGQGNTGNITADVSGTISLNQSGQINSQVAANAAGNAGDITLNSASLSLQDSSLIFTNVSGEGSAGNLNLTVSDRITLENSSFQARVEEGGIGDSGNIIINAGSLILNSTNQGFNATILASTGGMGNAGDISITATDISLTGDSSIQTQVQSTGVGSGGDITVTADSITLSGDSTDARSSLLANSSGNGDAGDIVINAGEINAEQFGLITNQASAGEGNSGDVMISADSLRLNTASFIISNTGDAENPEINSTGNAGNIEIQAGVIELDNFSLITNNVLANGGGTAGKVDILQAENITIAGGSNINSLTDNVVEGGAINIETANLELVTGGKIVTVTNSQGNAGNIFLNVSNQLTIDGENAPVPTPELQFTELALQNLESQTGLFANATNLSEGNSGSIEIVADQNISIVNGGEIAVDNQGTGNGGNLTITADSLNLANQSRLIAETAIGQAEQQPSNINLQLDGNLTLEGESQISAQAFNNANGGNVTIAADFIVAFPAEVDGNDIIASASEGTGGKIDITAEEIFGLAEGEAIPGNMTNDFDVTSEFGFDGSLELNTPEVDTTGGITELSVSAISPDASVQKACSADGANNSNLTLKGRGNIPHETAAILSSGYILSSEQVTKAPAAAPSISPQTPQPSNINLQLDGNLTLEGESQISAQA